VAKLKPKNLSDVLEIKITTAEILDLVKEMTRLRENGEKPDWYTAVAILSNRYEKQTGKVFCITERMQCFAELSNDERMRGWSIEAVEKDCILTNEAVFTAVALCPLKDDGNRVYFDPDDFFDIVLRESESEMRA
jgi:hypothetical protein